MKRWIAFALMFALIGGAALAHGGAHMILGTVVKVDEKQLTIVKKDGAEATYRLVTETVYERDGKPASHADVVKGVRASIHLAHDGKTATKVKIAR